jgi:hypothetical protein
MQQLEQLIDRRKLESFDQYLIQKREPRLISHLTLDETYILAGQFDLDIEIWAFLARNRNKQVRQRVAENPYAPLPVLQQLARDPDPDVRTAVAENPKLPYWMLRDLTNDENVDLRYALAENASLPIQIIDLLTHDKNPYVSHRAQQTLQSKKANEAPASTGNDNVLEFFIPRFAERLRIDFSQKKPCNCWSCRKQLC